MNDIPCVVGYDMCTPVYNVNMTITLSDGDGMLSSSDVASFPGFPMQE